MNPIIEWTALTTSGTRKPVNDDSWLVFSAGAAGSHCQGEGGQFSIDQEDLILAVSDGMGGGQAGDYASRLILEKLSKAIPKTHQAAAAGLYPDYLDHLEQAIHEVHQSINEKGASDPALKGMAATLTLAWLTPENIYVAHVGDTRLYLHRDGETSQLTEDHTFAWRKFNRGELSEYQYREHPRRSALFEVVGGSHEKLRPELEVIPYQSGDQFLLCTDGVVDGAWQKHIHATFLQNTGSTSSPAQALMSRAVANDGSDDTTLILFHIR